jgi:hypothetical protein
MKRIVLIPLLSLILITLAGIGCRKCDTCYPIGGLLGKENQECACEKCSLVPRVGSIIDTPQEILDPNTPVDTPVDPSTLSPKEDKVSDPSPVGS